MASVLRSKERRPTASGGKCVGLRMCALELGVSIYRKM